MAETAVDNAKYRRLRANGVPHAQAVAMAAVTPTADFSPPSSLATDLELSSALAVKAPLASPAFTGTPTKNGSPVQSQADVASAYVATVGAPTGVGATDRAAIQAAIDAANTAGGGLVWLRNGTYALDTPLAPKANVWLRGQGVGVTTLAPVGNVAAIQRLGTSGDPLLRATFSDFTIDGTNQTAAVYATNVKGIYVTYQKYCTYRDLEIKNTIATGIGIDFLVYCTVHNVTVDTCGRGNDGTQAGGNGIGIGTGGYAYEPFTVSDCNARNITRFGIMVEAQNPTPSVGGKIIGCHADGCQIGMVDSGMAGATWVANTMTQNVGAGFAVNSGTYGSAYPGKRGVISDNVIVANGGDGILYDATANQVSGGYRFHNNIIYGNSGWGVHLAAGAAASRMIVVRGNEIGANAAGGIGLTSAGGALIDIEIDDNFMYSASSVDAISIAANVTRGRVRGNRTTQPTGATAFTNAFNLAAGKTLTEVEIITNDFHNGVITAMTLSGTLTTCKLRDNYGYNPRTNPTAPTVGASPWTYTAGPTPEVLYLKTGTVSAVAKGGVNVANASPCSVPLAPNEAVTVTYSSAPIAVADRM